jgi:hypothetical protein
MTVRACYSYYLGPVNLIGINAGHVVNDPNGIEAHVDAWGPFTAFHNLFEALPLVFFNTRSQANAPNSPTLSPWTCSLSGGCHP